MRSVPIVPPLLAIFCLSACGGGGDSGDAGGNPPASNADVSVSAFVTDSGVVPSPTIIAVSLRDFPDNTDYVRVTYSRQGLDSAGYGPRDESSGEIHLEFQPPFYLAPGVYRDNVRIEGCQDSDCTRVVSQGARTYSVAYTVKAAAGANAPTVSFSPQGVQVQDLLTSSGATTRPVIDVNFTRAPIPPRMEVESTSNAITRVITGVLGDSRQQITLEMKTPAELGLGTYTDTLSVRLCIDPACINPYPGNPYTLSVEYSITNEVGGEHGYTVDVMPLPALDLVADPVRDLLYVSLEPASIAALDPVTRELTHSVDVGEAAGALAVSDDGQYLYASVSRTGKIRRFRLPQLTPDIDIDLGTEAIFGTPLMAKDIQVAPGHPRTIAVVLADEGLRTQGAVVFDDAIARADQIAPPANIYTDVAVDALQWNADGTLLFGANWVGQYDSLYDFSVDALGLRVSATTTGVRSSVQRRHHHAGGLLYFDDARVFDTATHQLLDPIPVGTCFVCRILPDAELGKVFVTGVAVMGVGESLQVHDMTTLAPIASARLPDANGVHHLARWGDDGLAMLGNLPGSVGIILYRGPLIGAQSSAASSTLASPQ